MKIIHQYQTGRSTCGQTCVAMVAGMPVENVIRDTGHAHGTRTRELVRLLGMYGFTTGSRLSVYRGNLPDLAILKIPHRRPDGTPRSGWHWVVYHRGVVYDPYTGIRSGTYKISSYLHIEEKK